MSGRYRGGGAAIDVSVHWRFRCRLFAMRHKRGPGPSHAIGRAGRNPHQGRARQFDALAFPALFRLGVLVLIQISKFREPEPEGGDRHVALRTQCAVHRSAARRNAAQVFSIEAEAGAGAGEQGKDRKTD